ncbi:hypothetical protein VTL71DRAFT_5929 [Oculimacula yallundae]|uniref:Uncharacterized protein n=1 Tax=Oculimacula yallundae TaxID=86028 RepID=A0ABR4BZ06_9HELO
MRIAPQPPYYHSTKFHQRETIADSPGPRKSQSHKSCIARSESQAVPIPVCSPFALKLRCKPSPSLFQQKIRRKAIER